MSFLQEVHVTNVDYYLAIEWEVIESMCAVQAGLKDVAKKAAQETGVRIVERVVEGYYEDGFLMQFLGIEKGTLAAYFDAIKALQEGKPSGAVNSDALKALDEFYHSTAFGLGPHCPTYYNPEPPLDWMFLTEQKRFLSTVVDGLGIAMKEAGGWNELEHNTPTILKNLEKIQRDGKMGKNIVALGALVDSIDHRYGDQIDPVCLTWALYTTVLSRAEMLAGAARVKYRYKWDVSPDVEELGTQVIEAYNAAIRKVLPLIEDNLGAGGIALAPFHSPDAAECIRATQRNDDYVGRERVVKIDSDEGQGYLHWSTRLDPDRNGCRTFTFVSPEIISPMEYKKDVRIIGRYAPKRAVDARK